jgi:alkanesulfonate monooxygenase SsuD/methylene tetrahydromethanopterin reductase-like flavin-dependent oxidoreductase (luciferase family)
MTTHRDRYPIRVGALLWPQQTDWAQMSEFARLADRAGLDSLWTGDHLLYRYASGETRGPWEAWTLLAGLAASTERIALGPLVAATSFHQPAMLAKMAATVTRSAVGG